MRRGLHAGIAIIVLLSVGLGLVAGLNGFPDVDWRFRPFAVAAAVLSLSVFMVIAAEVWRRLLRVLGPELQPRRGQAIWFTSALGRYVPTAALMPLLRMALAEPHGVPKRISMAAVVYETAIFFTASVLIGSYALIEAPGLEDEPLRFSILVVPALALIALQPRIFHRLADWALLRLGREPLPISLSTRSVAEFLLLYAISFSIAGPAMLAVSAMVYPLDAADLPLLVSAFAAANAISFIAFLLPGGLGAREAGMVLALAPVMPAGPAVAVAVLIRIIQMACEIVLAPLTQLLAGRDKAAEPAELGGLPGDGEHVDHPAPGSG